jgi:hypothetical protein
MEGMPVEQIFAAAGVWNEMAWSHDGTKLAFNAAIDGPSVDLYLYNTKDNSVTRLTDGPSHSVKPVFTLDDKYILHGAVDTLYWGFSGAGYEYLHVWAARSDNGGVHKVFNHPFYGHEHILGWLSDTEYVAASWEDWCYFFDVRVVDIHDGLRYTIYSGHHAQSAYAPGPGKLLFYLDEFFGGEDCKLETPTGVYMLDHDTRQQVLIPEIEANQVIDMFWHEEAGKFFVCTQQDVFYAVNPDGTVTEYQAPSAKTYDPPLVSPDGERWVFLDDNLMAFGDSDGHYSEYDVKFPHTPLWVTKSTMAIFFAKHNGKTAIFGSAIPGPRPLVLQPDVWSPRGIEKIVLVYP